MKFQTLTIPRLRNKTGESPLQNEKTVSHSLLENHEVPDGKVALIVINKGSLDFVWEDDPDTIYTADSSHPIVIEPGRKHHLIVHGRVDFKFEYYTNVDGDTTSKKERKPGADFIEIIELEEPIDKRIKRS